ncbi:MAG: hypothetical protein DMG78_20665 [Acidobacteria bacterium]|nr:MAG: hypothetical protein DMG78_20665 [Acidobacteriota bacterium]
MAGFNADLELGRIARESRAIQSKKLMWGIKGIYSSTQSGSVPKIDLLEFQRHYARVSRLILAIVHRDLLFGPCTGELIGSDQDQMVSVGDFEC